MGESVNSVDSSEYDGCGKSDDPEHFADSSESDDSGDSLDSGVPVKSGNPGEYGKSRASVESHNSGDTDNHRDSAEFYDSTESDGSSNSGKGSHQRKIVTFLWTLSVPPLAPPPSQGLRTLRGVVFLKARTSESQRLERKNT